ncbi:MAG: preprotein translocase subunit SecY [Alphaproteobacteria bacterium]|nr:MAG: preprotein translocase subunit SecY [Alphaproteobacteria bacterium]
MTSTFERMLSNIDYSAFGKSEDLKKRIYFTLAALIVYRLGTFLPLPGVDPGIMASVATEQSKGLLAYLNTFSGGALERMTIFALGIMPYISASIIVQLLSSVMPSLEALKKDGEQGRKRMNQYTRYLTVFLAIVQGYGMAVGLEIMTSNGVSAVIYPGIFFRLTSVVTLTGGTLFLMWLGEQITSRGIGNGVSLLIFAGIVANLPRAVQSTLELGMLQKSSVLFILGVFSLVIGMIAIIVFMERAQRRILIQYPRRQVGKKIIGGENSHLPIKINVSGVIPPIFASSILVLFSTLATLLASKSESVFGNLPIYLSGGHPIRMFIFVLFILFFAFFYTSIVFNPVETAENLKKNGAFVLGYRPGDDTANYFDYVLTRLTVVGALYLAFICAIPEFLMTKVNIPFYLGGTSLLIVVGVAMDTVAQVHSHLLAHQYKSLINKSQIGARSSR